MAEVAGMAKVLGAGFAPASRAYEAREVLDSSTPDRVTWITSLQRGSELLKAEAESIDRIGRRRHVGDRVFRSQRRGGA